MKRDITFKKSCGFKRFWSLPVLAVLCLVLCPLAQAGSPDSPEKSDRNRVIIIDPGHGGNDRGVKGPEGRLEKSICLELAKKIKKKLAGRCRVVLTRTGDYGVPSAQRASIANNEKGDLFISLHAGGGFRRAVDRWSIYFYRPPQDRKSESGSGSNNSGTLLWQNLQLRHSDSSALLAEKIRDSVARSRIKAAPGVTDAPLAVLKGVDMPAVVIEYGYLTHPETAGALADEQYLDDVAAALAKGISDFLSIGTSGQQSS